MSLATVEKPMPTFPGPIAQGTAGNVPRVSVSAQILILCLIGLAVSFGAYYQTRTWEQEDNRSRFDSLAYDQIHAIEFRLSSTIQVLRSIRGLFDASDSVEREEFKTFVDSLQLETLQHVQALEWIPRVSLAERDRHEINVGPDVVEQFQFTERNDQGTLVRAGARDYYYPVYFVEPLEGNKKAVGFDLGSSQARLAAMNAARDSGAEIASARITLVQESGNQFGFLIFIPIYKGGIVPESRAQRQADLLGFGLGVFRVGDLISTGALQNPFGVHPIDISLYDKSAPEGNQLLFTNAPPDAVDSSLLKEEHINFAGRSWSVVISPSAGSPFNKTDWIPMSSLIIGIVFTLFLTQYVYVVQNRRVYAEDTVKIRTAEILDYYAERDIIMSKLQQTNKDLESFAFIASHDLKAPLRGIDCLVSWIVEDEETHLGQESRENVDRLRTRIRRLERLLDDLLEYARFGHEDTKQTMVDCGVLCAEIVDYLAPPSGFDLSINIDIPPILTVKSALQTTLTNLISNAIKHHDRPKGNIRISARDIGQFFEFSVADDGPGIDPDHHDRVFEIFQTLNPRSELDSSGMGLSVVARNVAVAGGVIRIQSNADERGAALVFTWKKSDAEET